MIGLSLLFLNLKFVAYRAGSKRSFRSANRGQDQGTSNENAMQHRRASHVAMSCERGGGPVGSELKQLQPSKNITKQKSSVGD